MTRAYTRLRAVNAAIIRAHKSVQLDRTLWSDGDTTRLAEEHDRLQATGRYARRAGTNNGHGHREQLAMFNVRGDQTCDGFEDGLDAYDPASMSVGTPPHRTTLYANVTDGSSTLFVSARAIRPIIGVVEHDEDFSQNSGYPAHGMPPHQTALPEQLDQQGRPRGHGTQVQHERRLPTYHFPRSPGRAANHSATVASLETRYDPWDHQSGHPVATAQYPDIDPGTHDYWSQSDTIVPWVVDANPSHLFHPETPTFTPIEDL